MQKFRINRKDKKYIQMQMNEDNSSIKRKRGSKNIDKRKDRRKANNEIKEYL